MSDGKWSGHSLKQAHRFNSPTHTSDPVNQVIRVREKKKMGRRRRKVEKQKGVKRGKEVAVKGGTLL